MTNVEIIQINYEPMLLFGVVGELKWHYNFLKSHYPVLVCFNRVLGEAYGLNLLHFCKKATFSTRISVHPLGSPRLCHSTKLWPLQIPA